MGLDFVERFLDSGVRVYWCGLLAFSVTQGGSMVMVSASLQSSCSLCCHRSRPAFVELYSELSTLWTLCVIVGTSMLSEAACSFLGLPDSK